MIEKYESTIDKLQNAKDNEDMSKMKSELDSVNQKLDD